MIKQRTVFLLGAGASFRYGFPLGQKLCEDVIQALSKNVQGRHLLMNLKLFSEEQIEDFRRQLELSAQNSVDAFLEIRTEFLNIGKAAMAFILIGREAESPLLAFENNWMRLVFNSMHAPTFEEFTNNSVSFVTFNYDRSVEHFFFNALKNRYGKNHEECAAMMREHVPIIHLHGQLGHLPWQQRPASRAYDNTRIDREVLELCMQEIKVVHEDITDGRDKEFARAKKLLDEAEQIYCLGFGFGPKNIERLDIPNWRERPKSPLATTFGLNGRQRAAITRATAGKIALAPANEDCFVMLNDRAEFA